MRASKARTIELVAGHARIEGLAIVASALIACAAAGPAHAQSAESGDVETGTAIADYWVASTAEYAATAEAILNAVGAQELRHGSVAGSAAAELLMMFGGGGGAPQDLIRLSQPKLSTSGVEGM